MVDAKDQPESACPVDHKSREAWMSQAGAASPEGSQSLPPSHPTIPNTISKADAETCPVDHKAREVWTQQARTAALPAPAQNPPHPAPTPSSSSWTSYLPHIPFWSSSTPNQQHAKPPSSPLANDRVISTIPRSSKPGEPTDRPANTEQETGADEISGNWIYPSERMFFEAMKRKGHDPRAADMRTVVPIHNAVNERAWAEIKEWEEPWLRGSDCGGPRLHSFSGLSTNMSPKARINTLLGYQAPFDRHDWVVDRCGKEIEYIIDFYAGRNGGGGAGKLSFYLDVRPKLNTWEGVKMRAMRAAGLV
ncbi:cytochrome c and c1 heme-lyase [Annulohypoxylon maeteangense]|uniref:cytochrome c and c1 heme-lyase n=1 Tax=Annulohypoxylon maeteangense TaxID=1927788 RepID=UPI002007B9E0|nr:cytochrome c and c1 heme-lyase [Annulohypoxylon maeteangense]KAI0884941.1 cytochrome c and c1 heme-lyase [Annulohypoxylon maeteangense]